MTDIYNALIRNRSKWVDISDDDKEKYFFIINRYLSKDFPEQALKLNTKGVDPVSAMDVWYNFLGNNYAKNFWSKGSPKKKELSDKEIKWIAKNNGNIKKEDVLYLYNTKSELIKEEIKKLKELEKNESK